MLSCSHEFANIVTEKPRQGKHIFMVFECMALGTVKPEHNNLKTSLTQMFDKFEQLKLVLQCVTMCDNVWQCVRMCYNVLQCVTMCYMAKLKSGGRIIPFLASYLEVANHERGR